MTQAINNKLRLTGIADTLALAMTLSAAPAYDREYRRRGDRH